jgi:hypothetical protein
MNVARAKQQIIFSQPLERHKPGVPATCKNTGMNPLFRSPGASTIQSTRLMLTRTSEAYLDCAQPLAYNGNILQTPNPAPEQLYDRH